MMVSELKKKQRQIREKKVLNREDVYHGALEDILLGECGQMLMAEWKTAVIPVR